MDQIRVSSNRTIELHPGKLFWIRCKLTAGALPKGRKIPNYEKVHWVVAEYVGRLRDGYQFRPVLDGLFDEQATVSELDIDTMAEDEQTKMASLVQQKRELQAKLLDVEAEIASDATKQ